MTSEKKKKKVEEKLTKLHALIELGEQQIAFCQVRVTFAKKNLARSARVGGVRTPLLNPPTPLCLPNHGGLSQTTLWVLLKKKKNVLFNVAALLCFATLLKWLVGSNRVNLVGQSHCSQWRVKAISAARRSPEHTQRLDEGGARRARVRSPDGDPRYGGGVGALETSGPFSRTRHNGNLPLACLLSCAHKGG